MDWVTANTPPMAISKTVNTAAVASKLRCQAAIGAKDVFGSLDILLPGLRQSQLPTTSWEDTQNCIP